MNPNNHQLEFDMGDRPSDGGGVGGERETYMHPYLLSSYH